MTYDHHYAELEDNHRLAQAIAENVVTLISRSYSPVIYPDYCKYDDDCQGHTDIVDICVDEVNKKIIPVGASLNDCFKYSYSTALKLLEGE